MNRFSVLKEIQQLTLIYQTIEKDQALEEVGALLNAAEELRVRIDEKLKEIQRDSLDPQLLQGIREALNEAHEASERAQQRIEEEKEEIRSALNKFRVGSHVRQAYRPPAIGMGFTEGNFIDSKK